MPCTLQQSGLMITTFSPVTKSAAEATQSFPNRPHCSTLFQTTILLFCSIYLGRTVPGCSATHEPVCQCFGLSPHHPSEIRQIVAESNADSVKVLEIEQKWVQLVRSDVDSWKVNCSARGARGCHSRKDKYRDQDETNSSQKLSLSLLDLTVTEAENQNRGLEQCGGFGKICVASTAHYVTGEYVVTASSDCWNGVSV